MKTLKSVGFIFLVQAGIIGLIFGFLYLLKISGTSGGYRTQVLPFFILIGVTALMMKVRKHSFADIGLPVSLGVILTSTLFLATAVIPFFTGPVVARTKDPLLWNIAYFCLVGFSEELFFRGYIKTEFRDANPWIWRIVSALAFASLHFISSEELTVMLFILLTFYGVIFTILRDLLGTIVPLIAFHAAWDILSSYSENYGNVLWMFGAWGIMIIAAFLYNQIVKKKQQILNA